MRSGQALAIRSRSRFRQSAQRAFRAMTNGTVVVAAADAKRRAGAGGKGGDGDGGGYYGGGQDQRGEAAVVKVADLAWN